MGSNSERGFPDPAPAGRNTGGWKRAGSRDQNSQRGQGPSWGSLPVPGDSGHSQPCPCPRGSAPDPGQGKRDGECSPALRAFPKRLSRPQEDQRILFVPHQDAPEQLNQLNRSSAPQTRVVPERAELGAQRPGQRGSITLDPAEPGGHRAVGQRGPRLGQAPAVLPGAAAASWSGSPGSALPQSSNPLFDPLKLLLNPPSPECPESRGQGRHSSG